MKILNYQKYRDGGTSEVTTDKGVYCFDYRIGTDVKGELYLGYPKMDKSNLIENSEDLRLEIINALRNYKNEFYQLSIDYLLKMNETI